MHPILLRLGPVTLYSYGLMIGIGFLAAVWVASRRAGRLGMDPAAIQNLVLAGLVFGILGARALYVGFHWPEFRSNPMEMIRLDHGGLIFYGGFVAGLLAVSWILHRQRMPFWKTLDLLIPSLVLAHAFGRLGCFLNGCCYGKPTSVPWALCFPQEGIPRHPTQLYESAFLIVLFVALQWMERQSPPPGRILLTYGLAYGVWRFAIEFLRGDNPIAAGGLTAFQWASIALVLVSGLLLLLRRR